MCLSGGSNVAAAEGVEALSVLLGLLINLVEGSPANCEQLVSLELPSAAAANGGTHTMVPLLCQMVGWFGRCV